MVTNSCAFLLAREAAGALRHPAFPAPSFFRGTTSMHHSGTSCRGSADLCPTSLRGVKRRSNPDFRCGYRSGLLRFARNDGVGGVVAVCKLNQKAKGTHHHRLAVLLPVLMVRSRQRVRAKRGPMTGSAASRTMTPQPILRDARFICTIRDGLAVARPARVRALLRMRSSCAAV